jgi:hypothetical protein
LNPVTVVTQTTEKNKERAMQEREAMISYLLQQCDLKQRTIDDLQKQVAEYKKKEADAATAKVSPKS